MKKKSKPVHLIINPKSGYGGKKRILSDLRSLLAQTGRPLVEYVTQAAADATRYAHEIAPNASAVIAFGGDGTINEVAEGLAGSDVPLLIAAAGTENLLAKELRIPRNAEKLIDLLETGEIIECDIGVVNGKHFHSILGVGFDAEVVHRVTTDRTGHISHLSYFWPIWRTFWEHNFPVIRAWADGQEVYHGRGLAFVGNISRYSSGLRICHKARSDDGLLDLVIFRCCHQVGLLMHSACTMLQMGQNRESQIYRQAKTIRIEIETPQNCEVDGDVGPVTPLEISLSPHRNKLIVPPHIAKKHAGP
ncbi:MAG: diacylglycerol kinase family lipid kinase [Phycisphaerae bacterium]|nr:diacylglycerol kinase family lipid kinase [Phycisphaerae bacterium]